MRNSPAKLTEALNIVLELAVNHKEHIIKAFNEGTFSEMEKIDAEQYYNETYTSNETNP